MRPPAPGGLWLFGVGDHDVQLTWRSLGVGRSTIEVGDQHLEVETDGGPGGVVVGSLASDTAHDIVVTPAKSRRNWVRSFRTLPSPPGAELFRLSTLSDLHLGEYRFGYFKTMRERHGELESYPVRALRAACREMAEWQSELVIAKGDITDASTRRQWELFGTVIADLDVPVRAIGGNHDAGPEGRHRHVAAQHASELIVADDGLAVAGVKTGRVQSYDVPGLRIVLADTTVPSRHAGTLALVRDDIVDLTSSTTQPVLLLLHHQLDQFPLPHFWPPGVPHDEAADFLGALRAANPNVIVSSGHTHRHRRREMRGVTVTEVGSPKDFPGTWGGYVVHEGGIRQTVRRISAPDVLRWTDRSAHAALGLWGMWSPGRLRDRCFTHLWR